MQDKDITLSGEHVREGLTCVVSVKVPNPEFEGQTKVLYFSLKECLHSCQVATLGYFTFLAFHDNPLSSFLLFSLLLKDKVGKSRGAKSG